MRLPISPPGLIQLNGDPQATRTPDPLIKSQMLYRLSYERIFCNNTILPNNITINADKMQVPGRKFLRCTYEVPRGDFKRPNGLAAGEMEGFYPDKFLFTKPDRIVTIKANPIWVFSGQAVPDPAAILSPCRRYFL